MLIIGKRRLKLLVAYIFVHFHKISLTLVYSCQQLRSLYLPMLHLVSLSAFAHGGHRKRVNQTLPDARTNRA